MTATGHAVIGALIAAKFQNPEAVLGLSLVSHFISDLVPHWDPGTHHKKKTQTRIFIEAVADVLLSLFAGWFVYSVLLGQKDLVLLFFAIIFAQLPDWLSIPSSIFKRKIPPFSWVNDFQEVVHVTLDKPWGIVTQFVAVILVYLLLFRLS